MALAMNPNTPRTVLVRMIESQSSAARLAAFGYGKLPEDERHGYLRKGCSFTTANELITIAKDSATPEEVLKCLSENPFAECAVAENPATPIEILEAMSKSTDQVRSHCGAQVL